MGYYMIALERFFASRPGDSVNTRPFSSPSCGGIGNHFHGSDVLDPLTSGY